MVRETHGGVVPGSSEALRELPGVGEYTAGAVASIAFGEVVPAVDGNVKRVLSRIFDLVGPSPGEYRALGTALVDLERPGDFNQAMMELGALTCTPRSPRCHECPVASECLALERGTVAERPVVKERKPVPEEDRAVLVAVTVDTAEGLQFLLRKRPPVGLLAGMWEFPSVEVEVPGKPHPGPAGEDFREAAWGSALEHGFQVDADKPPQAADLTELQLVTHIFSHLRVRYRPFLLRVLSRTGSPSPSRKAAGRGPSPVWIPAADLDQVPIPVAQGKILKAALAALER